MFDSERGVCVVRENERSQVVGTSCALPHRRLRLRGGLLALGGDAHPAVERRLAVLVDRCSHECDGGPAGAGERETGGVRTGEGDVEGGPRVRVGLRAFLGEPGGQRESVPASAEVSREVSGTRVARAALGRGGEAGGR